MSGWEKVALVTALMVVALAAFNLAVWRRVRAAVRAARERADGHPDH